MNLYLTQENMMFPTACHPVHGVDGDRSVSNHDFIYAGLGVGEYFDLERST